MKLSANSLSSGITQWIGQGNVLYNNRKFGGGEVCRSDSFQAFGETKFGELTDQPIGY